uniref:Uncharacterized protein n=1 Tax=Rhizophagus irregularis (strain DAOM 181602 / DAOM 197198 / MUCL 43194) TaxID=747089 RepID=U9T2F2_RHIID
MGVKQIKLIELLLDLSVGNIPVLGYVSRKIILSYVPENQKIHLLGKCFPGSDKIYNEIIRHTSEEFSTAIFCIIFLRRWIKRKIVVQLPMIIGCVEFVEFGYSFDTFYRLSLRNFPSIIKDLGKLLKRMSDLISKYQIDEIMITFVMIKNSTGFYFVVPPRHAVVLFSFTEEIRLKVSKTNGQNNHNGKKTCTKSFRVIDGN